MSQLPISNVIQISVSAAQTGLGNYNTSNIGLFTDEAPNLSTFGNLGYALYLSPQQVGVDFGTSSETFSMANAIFSQAPNILAGGGALIVILMTNEIQHLAFSGIAASGTFEIEYAGAYYTAAINWNDTAAQIQTKLRAITGLEKVVVTGSIASQSLNIQFAGVYGPQSTLQIVSNTLATSGPVAITVTVTTPTEGEKLDEAISRTEDLVQYFGIIANEDVTVIGQTDLLAAAAVIQPLNKMGFFVSSVQADIEPGGKLDLLTTSGYTQSRGLYYGNTTVTSNLVYLASYAGRALSTNFSGSNTTQTMHLKVLVGVSADTTISQTILNLALDAGVDTYPSLQGVPCVFTSGANSFFDQVYNLRWFVGALQVAGFNYLATTSTKVVQTEAGMDGLKGAYRSICNQAITNAYGAPGAWNSATSFGPGTDLITNVSQSGYYIYSSPVALQSQADRVAREAPLIQLALKEAGAIQSSTVVVYVNP